MPEVTGMFVLRIINLVIEDIRDEIGKVLSCNRQFYRIMKGDRRSKFCSADCSVGQNLSSYRGMCLTMFDNIGVEDIQDVFNDTEHQDHMINHD